MMKCVKCDKKVLRGDGHSGLSCGSCSGLFHAECEGMTQSDLESFLSLSPVQRNSWNCMDCKNRRKNAMRSTQTDSGGLHLLNGRFDALEERFDRMEGLVSSLGRIEDLVSKLFNQFSDLKNDVNGLRQEVRHVREDVNDLHDENVEIKHRITQAEEKFSMEPPCDFRAVELHGVPSMDRRDVYVNAEKMLKETLDFDVEKRDLDDCFFIGGRTSASGNEDESQSSAGEGARGGSRQRTGILVIRFATRRMREEILRVWKEKRARIEGFKFDGRVMERFRIVERLNRPTRDLLKEARNAARRCGWRHVWTNSGKIFVRRENIGRVFTIHTLADLSIIT